jgi:putative Mn2+ efflux pump MntP
MDAFAVAVAAGVRLRRPHMLQVGRMAGAFGFFQFFMPVLGWLLGRSVQQYIEQYDHWLAFGLLACVGAHMLWETWKTRNKPDACREPGPDPTKIGPLLLLGIATSIDALAVGLSIAVLQHDIWLPACIIGLVCFCMTALGMQCGSWICRLGRLDRNANVLGGGILIGIGVLILHEHGVF